MVAGAIRIRTWHFMVATAIGITPGLVMATVYGEQFSAALTDPSRINYWLVAAVTLFFVAAILSMRAWLLRLERSAKSTRARRGLPRPVRPGKKTRRAMPYETPSATS
jgi:uncharacterized membrane protein YdjX (TVP38/TMEM64 family)